MARIAFGGGRLFRRFSLIFPMPQAATHRRVSEMQRLATFGEKGRQMAANAQKGGKCFSFRLASQQRNMG
jgi:hypothetical protein